MREGAIQVGPNRYRETFGRYFDDFKPGDVYEHRPGRTITEADKLVHSAHDEHASPAF
jgi:itaconyl-CoA hydratase